MSSSLSYKLAQKSAQASVHDKCEHGGMKIKDKGFWKLRKIGKPEERSLLTVWRMASAEASQAENLLNRAYLAYFNGDAGRPSNSLVDDTLRKRNAAAYLYEKLTKAMSGIPDFNDAGASTF